MERLRPNIIALTMLVLPSLCSFFLCVIAIFSGEIQHAHTLVLTKVSEKCTHSNRQILQNRPERLKHSGGTCLQTPQCYMCRNLACLYYAQVAMFRIYFTGL